MTLSNKDRQQLIANYIEKAKNTEKALPNLLANNQLFAAVNRIYYAIFYMLSALALQHQFSTSKHTQLLGWFNKNFVKTQKIERKYGKYIQDAFEMRMKGDYEVLANFSENEVQELFEKMQATLCEIERLLM
jgi:uncharacterized protein (UPF0332 family)